jgi:acetolactate decarboxylase
MPDFLSGLHMTGLHLHVITADRKHGGHQLGAVSDEVTATLQHAPSIELGRPLMPDFLTMSRRRNMEADLDRVER